MTLDNFSFQINLTTLGAMVAVGWFFWQRYQALENRFDNLEKQIEDLRHRMELGRQAMQATTDNLHYLVNSNTQLIDHRTQRFLSDVQTLEARLKEQMNDVKGYLTKTTDFVDRQRQ